MEGDPTVTGRWGPSALLLPTGAIAHALDALTREVLDIAGDGHWASGSLGAAHFTVRALEHFGTPARPGQIAALTRAAHERITLEVAGVRMTDTAVMASAVSPDGSADRLRRRYAEEIGDDGWLEDAFLPGGRTPVWYSTLVHYAAPSHDPARLAEWVAARQSIPIGTVTFDESVVCEWRFDGRRMLPATVASVPLVRG